MKNLRYSREHRACGRLDCDQTGINRWALKSSTRWLLGRSWSDDAVGRKFWRNLRHLTPLSRPPCAAQRSTWSKRTQKKADRARPRPSIGVKFEWIQLDNEPCWLLIPPEGGRRSFRSAWWRCRCVSWPGAPANRSQRRLGWRPTAVASDRSFKHGDWLLICTSRCQDAIFFPQLAGRWLPWRRLFRYFWICHKARAFRLFWMNHASIDWPWEFTWECSRIISRS